MTINEKHNTLIQKLSTAAIIETTIQQSIQMLQDGELQHKILPHLINTAEQIAGNDSVVSILVLDKNGLLRNSCSPRLPYDYLTAIDGLKPNPQLGTCAGCSHWFNGRYERF